MGQNKNWTATVSYKLTVYALQRLSNNVSVLGISHF